MRRKPSGFTVIELMIVLVIAAIALALAVPSYTEATNRRAVTNAAEQVATFMRVARSEAIKRNLQVSITLDNSGANFCAGVDDSASDCNCNTAGSCSIDLNGVSTEMTIDGSTFEGIKAPVLRSGATNKNKIVLTFDPVRGVLDNANDTASTFVVTSDNDKYELQVDTTLTGRIEICSSTTKVVRGFQACP